MFRKIVVWLERRSMRIVREVPRDSTYYAARSRIVRVLFSKALRAYSRGRYLLVAHLKYQGFKKEAQKKKASARDLPKRNLRIKYSQKQRCPGFYHLIRVELLLVVVSLLTQ